MKEYIAEYIVPVAPADEKGKNLKFDFMNAKRLIRCMDCKYGKEDEDGTIECTFWDFMDHTHHNDPEGFCYRAKRRGEE